MIDASFFKNNRLRLIQGMHDTGVVALTAHTGMQLVADSAASFRQESNFWYLTGIEEPDWSLVMTENSSWLVRPNVSSTRQIFEGLLSADEAKFISGVDHVVSADEFEALIKRLSSEHSLIGLLGPDPGAKYYDFFLNPAVERFYDRLSATFRSTTDIRPSLKRLRAIKQPEEVKAIEQAVDLTVRAFESARSIISNGVGYEYEVEAVFAGEFRRNNAHHAYEPIVASGKNACTLHYVKNTQRLGDKDLVLIDIGARVGGYSADITRTYAATISPTDRQRAVHQAVLSAHRSIIELIKPGVSIRDYHERVDEIMEESIGSLGLVTKPSDYRVYFPHAISHGLGVDVHDSLAGFDEFTPGMVLTVEPGIYVPEESIGVRLEDDILVTEDGHRNLSGALSLEM